MTTSPPDSQRPAGRTSSILRGILFSIGIVAVALGIAGIFLPLLPTVPFLILAAACFARSSEKAYRWIREHSTLGPILSPYLGTAEISRRSRTRAIIFLWTGLAISMLYFIPLWPVRIALLVIGGAVTRYLLRLPLREDPEE